MNDEGGRHDPVNYYGLWAPLVGLAFGGGVIWVMFAFADSFS